MLDSAYRGTRVLEIASGLSAGMAGRFFADLGAEVLRVEQLAVSPHDAAEAALLDWTRLNKRTLRTPPGGEELAALAAGADVLIADTVLDVLPAELQTPEALVERYPHLVALDITTLGRTGPYAGFASNDLVELALSGYLYVCG